MNPIITPSHWLMISLFHFEFKYLIPHDVISRNVLNFVAPTNCTYLTLPVDYPPENLENKFPEIVSKYFASEIERRTNIV